MLNSQGFIVTRENRIIDRETLNLERSLKPIVLLTDEELLSLPAGSVFVSDTECYKNYWAIGFKHVETGKYVIFERSEWIDFNTNKLVWMFYQFCIVGFNWINYDMPMVAFAIKGASNYHLKLANDYLIPPEKELKDKVSVWDFSKKFNVKIPKYNIIDLFNVAPLEGGLKLYAGRLHCRRMQDLPYDINDILTKDQAALTTRYMANDLDNTELLYLELKPHIELRIAMGRQYKIDLRSKSDAQLAQAVINSELEKLTGVEPKQVTVENLELEYIVPPFVQFATPELQKVLKDIAKAKFKLDWQGSPIWPEGLGQLEKNTSGNDVWVLKVELGGFKYKLGMGGLHSEEKSIGYVAAIDEIIADNDVESFYPRIILILKLFPPHLGEVFLQVYNTIVETRLQAKGLAKSSDISIKEHNQIIADSLKIVINGSFGKLGNKWSTLYAPQLMLQVTITGQLVLLMLIEAFVLNGIKVISANTDGFVSMYNKDAHNKARAIISGWEQHTGFKTEETRYAALYSRDVNNYIACKATQDKVTKEWFNKIDGFKVKGVYSEKGSALNSVLSKNPETLICSLAVQEFIKNGTALEKTIVECKDIRKFVSIKKVKNGGEKDGVYLGKIVRWYYAKGEHGYIAYVGSGNKVAKSDGARPIMDLPDEFPTDINYSWYIKEANDILYEIGYYEKPKQISFF